MEMQNYNTFFSREFNSEFHKVMCNKTKIRLVVIWLLVCEDVCMILKVVKM